MDHRTIIIDEKRGLNISLGLLFHFLISAVLIGLGYSAMRGEIGSALEQSQRNETELHKTEELLDKLRMDQNTMGAKLDEFLHNYDQDMNRLANASGYIRERNERR